MPFSVTKSRLLVAVSLIIAVLGLSLILPAVAAGQQVSANGTNATVDTGPESLAGTVGPIEIRDYRLEGGTMVLELQVQQHTAYAVGDALAGLRSEGVTTLSYKQGTLEPGRRTLRLDVTTVDGAGAVTLSTPRDAVRVQSEAVSGGGPPIPFTYGLLAVVVTSIGTGWFSFRRARAQIEQSDEPEVRRIG